MAYVRRLSPLEATYTKERATEICLQTLKALGFDLAADPNIRPDLDDRPQKSPRACVIASDPPSVVHLITRAQGGLHDYQAFLHEAGHALHYAGCDPALPYTFRRLSRDHALTEIYSYIVEAISREPGWHALHFGLSDEEAAAERGGDDVPRGAALPPLLREARVRARVLGSLPRGRRHAGRLRGALTAATGVRYRPTASSPTWTPASTRPTTCAPGSARRSCGRGCVEEVGEDWWRSPETGERLRALFREGTRPSSEEIAGRLGFDPLDTGPLLHELGV